MEKRNRVVLHSQSNITANSSSIERIAPTGQTQHLEFRPTQSPRHSLVPKRMTMSLGLKSPNFSNSKKV